MSQITVQFHKRRLEEDQDVYVREGDFVLYGDILTMKSLSFRSLANFLVK
jgi:hypothetical protein